MVPRKIDEKITGKMAKNDLKLAKIDQTWPSTIWQIHFLLEKIFEFLQKQFCIKLGYLIEIQELVLT